MGYCVRPLLLEISKILLYRIPLSEDAYAVGLNF